MQLSAEQILNPSSGTFAALRVEDEIRNLVGEAHPGTTVECEVKVLGCGRHVAIALGEFPAPAPVEPEDGDATVAPSPTRAGFLECAEGASELEAMLKLEAKVLERIVPERRVTLVPEGSRISDRFPRKTLRDN